MPAIQISYLADHPEYIPQLAEWLFAHWDPVLNEGNPAARIRRLEEHLNREVLPIAWVAHADGKPLGTAALRVHDLEGREDLTPWLGGVFVGPGLRRAGVGAALCNAVENAARSRGIETLYLFTLDRQAWYARMGWALLEPCVWHGRPGDIMCKQLRA